jgi:hypothetical protein
MRSILLVAVTLLPATAVSQDFLTTLWPVMERAQCRLCHNDNGVGSTTRLQLPRENATDAQIRAFGLRLGLLVDRVQPEESLLLRKPTNRTAHAGGERIKPGTGDEKALRAWVDYLLRQPAPAIATTRGDNEDAPRPVLRRLTHSQYNHTVRDLLGDDSRPADGFPKEDFVHGFTNQAEGQSVSPLQAEAYGRAAERLARAAFRGGDARGLIPCAPSMDCRQRFIREFGRRAFRRPLASEEAARYEKLFASQRDFLAGAQLVVEAMLQSPHFLFHLEPGPWATASRLSYFLWDTMPDEELFRAAESGRLEVEKQARRMLNDERARQSLDVFLSQWMRFDRLESAIRDRRLYPEFTTELVAAMTEETRLLFRRLVWEEGNFMEFFSGRYTHLSPELAKLYGVEPPTQPWARVVLPAQTGRAGVLGQATFLALTSKPADTSPTERGLFIREHFLCQQVPPPPAGVNTTLPPVTDEKPINGRQRLDIHLSNAACAGCHQLVDPIGFGFEHYDAIGRWRDKELLTIHPTADEIKTKRKTKPTEYALDIEAKGFVRGLKNSEFTTPRELGEILAREPACQRCIVKQLLRYATGKPEEAGDQPAIDRALDRFRASQFRFRELIIAIVGSEAFLGGENANVRTQP